MTEHLEDLEQLVDEDLLPAAATSGRPVRRRGLGTRLDALEAAAAVPAPRAAQARWGRGLAALIPEPGAPTHRTPAPEPPAPVHELPPALTRALLDAPRRAEVDWLLARDTPGVLHHATLGIHDLTALAEVEHAEAAPGSAIGLSCGQIVARVSLPGVDDRDPRSGRPRCAGCCAATGVPVGTGSPGNDPGAAAAVTARLAALPPGTR